MDALTIHRKARLKTLIDGKPWEGNQAQFASKVGVTKARITQLLDPNDSFGERAAKNIADKLELPDRYFEMGFSSAIPQAEQGLVSLLEQLNIRTVQIVKKDAAKLPTWVTRAVSPSSQYLPDFIVLRDDNTHLYVACVAKPMTPYTEALQEVERAHPDQFVVVNMEEGIGEAALKIQAKVAEMRAAPLPRELAPPAVEGLASRDFVAVRRADVSFSNGHGQVVYSEDDRPPLVFRADFLRRMGIAAGNAVVIEAEGVSNEPKIPDGAVVLINRGDREHLNGDLFAFRVDGELLIKRLERLDGGGILAVADNPNFKPKQKVYMNPPDFEVIGKAVWTGALL